MTDKSSEAVQGTESQRWHLLGIYLSWIWGLICASAMLAALLDNQDAISASFGLSAALSLPFVRDFAAKQIGVSIPDWIRAVLLVGLLVVAGSLVPAPANYRQTVLDTLNPSVATLPLDLAAFDKIIADAKVKCDSAENDLVRAGIRKSRDDAILAKARFSRWPGTITRLSADAYGDAYIVVKPDKCACALVTGTPISDPDAVIMAQMPLFQVISTLHVGDHVVVAGQIYREYLDDSGDGISYPEWITSFRSIELR
jgi:hypothetical protein